MCMTTVHRDPSGELVSFTKGAAEVVLERSSLVETSCGPRVPTREDIRRAAERMAKDGLRVLAIAMRRWPALEEAPAAEEAERDLTLLGLVGIMDPPHDEARAAVESCKSAGIVPVMITGDHPVTAPAIAQRVGLLADGGGVLGGGSSRGSPPTS
jgi:Ca2+-transporting ATPase